MQDIFISKLPSLLDSWVDAFPEACLVASIREVMTTEKFKVEKPESIIFWLHMNEYDQKWVESSVAFISKDYQGAKIVVLANTPSQAGSIHALSLGAMGYSHAYAEAAVLNEIKAVISHGGLWLGQDMLQRIIEVSTKLIRNQPDYVEEILNKLTGREKEVAIEVSHGLSNKEIARVLNITDRTVKAHLTSIFERLGAKDRLQVALMLNRNFTH